MNPVTATLVFTGGPWAWAGAALAVLGAVWAIVGYRRRWGAGGRVLVPLGLRLIALALLALCLAEPAWVGEEAEPGANIVAVLADNSSGMQVRDAGERETRAEQLTDLLTEQSGGDAEWLAEMERTFSLRRFSMDASLGRVNEFRELSYDGMASAIGGSLESVVRRFAGRPVAAVVLLTDGNSTDEVNLGMLDGMPPIFPVVIGGDAPERDLGVTTATVSESSFEDAPLTIRADVVMRGYRDRAVTVRLRDRLGTELEARELKPESNTETRSLRFLHRPPGTGVQFYRVEVEGDGGEEATLANNERLVTVNRGKGPYRILYVSGRPNWEYKFLNRSLEADPELALVGLIRVARREPKFQWRGRSGESANPLFRGFNPDDDTADYDQPVLVRLNTRDDRELSAGFPREAADLFGYHAIVVDDLERSFFTVDQMELLEAFVSRRGGSLLMLGGAESFAHGGYDRTPVARMLPVHLGRAAAQAPGRQLKLDLTRDGWLSPWMRLREGEVEERERLAAMSPFKTLNKVAGIKPGATVLAHVDDEGTRRPALAVQRFGSGRVGAMMIGDLWRWGFRMPEGREDMEKSWRQVVRWLIADVPERVTVELEEAGEGAVRARVEVRDEAFEAMPDARVTLKVGGGEVEAVELNATPSDTEPGIFEVTLVPAMGETVVTATARDAGGLPLGEARDGWVSNGAADEFNRLEPNRAMLETIAARTGGRVLEAGELASFAGELPKMDAPEKRTWSRSLWHTPPVFLLVLACFAGEWIVRRRTGMA